MASSGPSREERADEFDAMDLSLKERVVFATTQRPAVGLVIAVLLLISLAFLLAFVVFVASALL